MPVEHELVHSHLCGALWFFPLTDDRETRRHERGHHHGALFLWQRWHRQRYPIEQRIFAAVIVHATAHVHENEDCLFAAVTDQFEISLHAFHFEDHEN